MTFQEFLENEGYETRAYSGRGMYGRECLAITVRNPIQVAQDIGWKAARTPESDFPQQVRTDSMGLDYVIYWPNEKYEDGDSDTNDQDMEVGA